MESGVTDNCPACGALPCDWVTNPHALPPSSAPLLEALEEIQRLLSYAENEGKPEAVRESNTNQAFLVAHDTLVRAALAAAKVQEKTDG